MRWLLRATGLVFALVATMAMVLVLPVGEHHGITPIHCTTADTAMFALGYFLLFFASTALGVERLLVALSRPAIREDRSTRVPRARVVVR